MDFVCLISKIQTSKKVKDKKKRFLAPSIRPSSHQEEEAPRRKMKEFDLRDIPLLPAAPWETF